MEMVSFAPQHTRSQRFIKKKRKTVRRDLAAAHKPIPTRATAGFTAA